MPRYRLTIEYDGARLFRLAAAGERTLIQQALEEAIRAARSGALRASPARAAPTPACTRAARSRMSISSREWPGWRLREAINAHLVAERISVVEAAAVGDDFDARRSAIRRHYRYVIVNRRAPLVFERGRAWLVKTPLDAPAMREAAQALIGRHDFSTFRDCAMPGEFAAAHARLSRGRAERRQRSRFDVGAPLVPASAGALDGRLARRGRRAANGARRIFAPRFEAADRSRCGPVAPPDGLYLERVDYPPKRNSAAGCARRCATALRDRRARRARRPHACCRPTGPTRPPGRCP